MWAAHFAVVEGDAGFSEPQYKSNRANFLGRGREIDTGVCVHSDGNPLSNTVGLFWIPYLSRCASRVGVPPGKSARVAFWTLVAPSRR